jgi:diguanylate cyclase (GGDEF)-like protein
MFLDLDRFKLINDSFSHAVGDQLLIATAARLSEVLRPGDTIARLGGDEFTVLVDGTSSSEQASCNAQRICEALAAPFQVANQQLFVRASVGIALSQPGETSGELLRNADIAMYYAKQRGGGAYALYDDAMHASVVSRLTREGALRQAVEQSLIRVHYQPIVDLVTGRIRSLEALARWPEGWPPLAPVEFIPIAEECGLISALGEQVLQAALAQLASWRTEGLVDPDTCMSVNISRLQLDDPALPEAILKSLETSGIPPQLLQLEITESTLVHEPERIMRIVGDVCSQGVGLHLDDFGTGYSSLSALAQFPVNALKIDRSFINPTVVGGEINQAIVRSTIALGHTLGLEVIAEGVETRRQLNDLGRLGCEYGQGYLYSRPQDAEATEALLRRWDPLALRALDPQL